VSARKALLLPFKILWLFFAVNLTRFGINVEVIDDRADQTPVGR
jgi:hypothetical protein